MNGAALAICTVLAGVLAASPSVGQTQTIHIGFLYPSEREQTLSIVDRPPPDLGLAGAELAVADNATTGAFTGQDFMLDSIPLEPGADLVTSAAREAARLAAAGAVAIVTDLPAEALLAASDAAPETLLLNIGAPDDALRLSDCRPALVHVTPSRAMLADALAQFLVWKKWPRWYLISGSHDRDRLFAEALRRAAGRFGASIVEERVFEDTGGARTTDSGHVQVQRQIPVFTQGAAEHDVVVVADESEVFGTYLPFNTWSPRPVVGSAGLVPSAWSPAHEQWGAIQLQNRFRESAGRAMQDQDALAWMAVRMVGEAATRKASADAADILDYVTSEKFELGGFKGEALTIRPWNNQLRQPILLSDARAVVSVSPQEGFLHPGSFLDTLGFDRPESSCTLR